MSGKLVVVSNRGPYVIRGRTKERAVGGLVTAMEPVVRASRGTWVAWGGREGGEGEFSGDGSGYSWREVPLSREEITGYYLGFANRVLWPLCHCLID
ncbi:MAG: trehalose-6-phosphate synthase, partial [Firmicutes bacterium]|nr:trehalose-6-phosphate synthase [Bacillota bacterium]